MREVVALDLPGFGESPALPETTVATLADAVALFLSALGLRRADLVGTSLGGRLVLEMVRRGLGRVLVGWGRWDRLTLPTQARRALAAFPDARLHRFARSGHFPMFDSPDETVRVVLGATA